MDQKESHLTQEFTQYVLRNRAKQKRSIVKLFLSLIVLILLAIFAFGIVFAFNQAKEK